MSDKQLPFSALRALEAASRHESYTYAARELAITHSAVSQSIKRLEEELGAKLFERQGGAMRPLPPALQLARAYSEAADSLSRSLREIGAARAPDVLTLSAPSDLGRLWIAPRLEQLEAVLSNVVVDLRTSAPLDGGAGGELFIGHAPADQVGEAAEVLPEVMAFPVCSPAYAARFGLSRASDLKSASLLADPAGDWTGWLASADVRFDSPPRQRRLEDAVTALEAAAGGLGVTLTHGLAAASYLEAGRLVAPVPLAVPVGPLTLAHRGTDLPASAWDRVVGWLVDQAELTLRALGDRAPR